jgi:hypothetical protein
MPHSAKRKRNANVEINPSVLPDTISRLERAGILLGLPSVLRGRIGVAPLDPDEIQQSELTEPLRFACEYLGQNILSKFDDGKPSADKEAETWKRFFAAEVSCSHANARLAHPLRLSQTTGISVWSVIETAARKIEWLLGAYSEHECEGYRNFTSGASLLLARRQGSAPYKYSGKPETTVSNLQTAAQSIFPLDSVWSRAIEHHKYFQIFDGNEIQCVPKNWKTDRTIAIEPSLNMYVQKGLGTAIRRRLRKVGIDLDDQTLNQNHAREGSISGDRATIDLSMASDTISYEIVRLLLPPDWLLALEQCRSPVGVLPSGDKVVYRKFSSMGNGYTFELESLIFWALTWAVTFLHDGDMSLIGVYGDDLIVDTNVVQPLTDVLSYCGFTTNVSKTHIDGPFRESCGKHYFNGIDVTPFFVKKPVDNLSELFKFHNRLYRWRNRVAKMMLPLQLEQLDEIVRSIRAYAPASWQRPRIPDGIGDGAFIGTFDECQPSKLAAEFRTRKGRMPYAGWEGWRVSVLQELAEQVVPAEHGLVSRRTKKFVRKGMKAGLDLGYLTYKLAQTIPSGWEQTLFPVEGGGLSLSPRYRIIEILVTHYSGFQD